MFYFDFLDSSLVDKVLIVPPLESLSLLYGFVLDVSESKLLSPCDSRLAAYL